MDIMADLETMGTRGNTAFVSLGAVAFNPKDSRVANDGPQTFYANVNLQSCIDAGMTVSGDTIMWWLGQSDAARKSLSTPTPLPVESVLKKFAEWWAKNADRNSFIWSHGATFDIPIIADAFTRFGMKAPWFFSKAHDTRTIFDLVGQKIPDADTRTGGHNSLADAIAQAEHLQKCLAAISTSPLFPLPKSTIIVPETHTDTAMRVDTFSDLDILR